MFILYIKKRDKKCYLILMMILAIKIIAIIAIKFANVPGVP